MRCLLCGKPKAEVEPRVAHFEPAGVRAHADNYLPQEMGKWSWVGFVRGRDGVWRLTAQSRTLKGCWDALLSSWVHGEMLVVPVLRKKKKAKRRSKQPTESKEGTG